MSKVTKKELKALAVRALGRGASVEYHHDTSIGFHQVKAFSGVGTEEHTFMQVSAAHHDEEVARNRLADVLWDMRACVE